MNIASVEFFNPSCDNIGRHQGVILDETFDVFKGRVNVQLAYDQLYKITNKKVREQVSLDRCIVNGNDIIRKRYIKNKMTSADITRVKRECYALLYFDHPNV